MHHRFGHVALLLPSVALLPSLLGDQDRPSPPLAGWLPVQQQPQEETPAPGQGLAAGDSVIRPPANVDPAITKPVAPAGSPGTDPMPVVPPPGTPGGDPNVVPK
jgi:hypothetical protein